MENMPVDEKDFGCEEFADLLAGLEDGLPISSDYNKNMWWLSEKEYMVDWFRVQDAVVTDIPYARKPYRSAKQAYEALVSEGGILWINEALGVDPQRVQATAEAAKAFVAENSYGEQYKVALEYLPWSGVFEKAQQLKIGREKKSQSLIGRLFTRLFHR